MSSAPQPQSRGEAIDMVAELAPIRTSTTAALHTLLADTVSRHSYRPGLDRMLAALIPGRGERGGAGRLAPWSIAS